MHYAPKRYAVHNGKKVYAIVEADSFDLALVQYRDTFPELGKSLGLMPYSALRGRMLEQALDILQQALAA